MNVPSSMLLLDSEPIKLRVSGYLVPGVAGAGTMSNTHNIVLIMRRKPRRCEHHNIIHGQSS